MISMTQICPFPILNAVSSLISGYSESNDHHDDLFWAYPSENILFPDETDKNRVNDDTFEELIDLSDQNEVKNKQKPIVFRKATRLSSRISIKTVNHIPQDVFKPVLRYRF